MKSNNYIIKLSEHQEENAEFQIYNEDNSYLIINRGTKYPSEYIDRYLYIGNSLYKVKNVEWLNISPFELESSQKIRLTLEEERNI